MGRIEPIWAALQQVKTLDFIAHRRNGTGWMGHGKGKVVVEAPTPEIIIFHESGRWLYGMSPEPKFRNVSRWLRSGDTVRLEHLRFGENHSVSLFDLTPETDAIWVSVAPYLCGTDEHTGRLEFKVSGILWSWKIRGPEKNEEFHLPVPLVISTICRHHTVRNLAAQLTALSGRAILYSGGVTGVTERYSEGASPLETCKGTRSWKTKFSGSRPPGHIPPNRKEPSVMESIPVRRALLSVSDKTGLVEFAKTLAARGVEIVSTGGTAKALEAAGVPVVGISDLTGFPEMLEGRVKTLHPNVHGGILADRDKPDHMATIAEHGIGPIDLVVVNLYPFAATIAKPGVTLEDAIENIDIGGPSMVRSAAKNHHGVAIVVDPADYTPVLSELESTSALSLSLRKRLMAKAYAHTAAYDATIADYFEKTYAEPDADTTLPATFRLMVPQTAILRYGENPHQKAGFYKDSRITEPCIGNAVRCDNSGKEVSFNNLYDLDGALELVKEFTDGPAAAIIKHANPCGCAMADTLAEAFIRARAADTVSAFGGILAVNRPLDAATAEEITGPNSFLRVHRRARLRGRRHRHPDHEEEMGSELAPPGSRSPHRSD